MASSGPTKNPVEVILEKLRKYPHVTYRIIPEDSNAGPGIEIDPPNPGGFSVKLISEDDWTVYFGDGHYHFEDAETALECFAFCLSADCRMIVDGLPFRMRYTLERRTDVGWEWLYRFSIVPLLRFWKPRTRAVFQNTLIPSAFDARSSTDKRI